jgi:hypothetical protein
MSDAFEKAWDKVKENFAETLEDEDLQRMRSIAIYFFNEGVLVSSKITRKHRHDINTTWAQREIEQEIVHG